MNNSWRRELSAIINGDCKIVYSAWIDKITAVKTFSILILIGLTVGDGQSALALCSAASHSGLETSQAGADSKNGPGAPVDESLKAAHQKLEHGDAQAAIEMLEKLAASANPPKGIHHELGIAYYRAGKLQLADKAFADAIAENPGDMESVQMRGLTFYRLGRPSDAIPFLERVRQWTPNANADANYVLGLCYVNVQRFDDARTAFAAQFGIAPNSGPSYLLLGKMLMQLNFPENAAESAKKAIELSPNLPLAHFLMGEYFLSKSDTDQALREFEAEQTINPTDGAVYDRLGDVYTRQGKFQQAQESLSKAIALDKSSTGPFIQMGKVLLRRDDPQTSLLYLQHAEKMDPGNYLTHTLLGQAYKSLGRNEDAKREIDMASKILAAGEPKLQPAQ